MDELKERIMDFVSNGTKMTQLTADLFSHYARTSGDGMFDRIIPTVQEMIDDGSIIEIEYVLPSMTYRTKSFLVPANTDIFVGGDKISTRTVSLD